MSNRAGWGTVMWGDLRVFAFERLQLLRIVRSGPHVERSRGEAILRREGEWKRCRSGQEANTEEQQRQSYHSRGQMGGRGTPLN